MSKTGRPNHRRSTRESGRFGSDKHIVVISVQRQRPDLRKLSRAVITIATEEIARDTETTVAESEQPSDGGRA
ncbi:hypothetical protein ACFYO7_27990 [Nocardia salmonicida]|uniref:hypothetical protein n=1 Tax=Nocardia salmonicida TaxID=53431 RepID=UPI00367F4321